jgi:hypothetical protein
MWGIVKSGPLSSAACSTLPFLLFWPYFVLFVRSGIIFFIVTCARGISHHMDVLELTITIAKHQKNDDFSVFIASKPGRKRRFQCQLLNVAPSSVAHFRLHSFMQWRHGICEVYWRQIQNVHFALDCHQPPFGWITILGAAIATWRDQVELV